MIWVLGVLIVVAAIPVVIERRRPRMSPQIRQTAPGQFATLSLGLTHYQWIGPIRGPVAVCVHGLTTPSFVWQGLARGLSAMGYRVLVYDLYGRGYSDRPTGEQNQDFFVNQLEELLADQNVDDDFTLIGYSMGGAIATAFASHYPNRVRQLVLLASAGLNTDFGRLTEIIQKVPLIGDWLMLACFPVLHRRTARAEIGQPSSVPDISDLMQNELRYQGYVPAVLAALRGILTKDMSQDLQKIHRAGVPLLAVWARHDTTIPLSSLGRLTTVSRSAKQEVIDDAGHGLVYTHTDAVLGALRETLQDGLN
ncbi:alpha/beta hydrolase [Rhodobacteraceae bacterium M382]|nr:alpha/beta hydrolase [Rhodobacteraceae bacterium M382]